MKNKFLSFSVDKRFSDLALSVQQCTLCSRLHQRCKVLSYKNGNINSKVLFIAEAPGRLGADKTGIPLYGDRTGNNFDRFLSNISWKRDEIFITNAVLCNPRSENGNNTTPTRSEIENCSLYLEMLIEIISPEVIVTLGSVALASLNIISAHKIILREHVGEIIKWNNSSVFPLYHPGPRALIHRSEAKQLSDYIKLSKIIKPLLGKIDKKPSASKFVKDISRFEKLAFYIINKIGRLTYFKLTKLLYLIDLHAIDLCGASLTGEIYIRQEEGPWPPALKQFVTIHNKTNILFLRKGAIPIVELGPSFNYQISFSDKETALINETLHRHFNSSNAKIKTAVYCTYPMKYILSEEKKGRDMRKIPVIYKDKTANKLDRQDDPIPQEIIAL